MSSTPEYRAIDNCSDQLEIAFNGADRPIVHYLRREGYINDTIRQQVLNPRSMLSGMEKAGLLVEGIKEAILLDKSKFHSLISHLRDSGKFYSAIVRILTTEFDELSKEQEVKKIRTRADPDDRLKENNRTLKKSRAEVDPDDGLIKGSDDVKSREKELEVLEKAATEGAGMSLSLDEVKKTPSIVKLLGLKEVHERGITGKGTKLAIIDKDYCKHDAIKHVHCYEVDEDGIADLGKDSFIKHIAEAHGTKVAGIAAGQAVPQSYYLDTKTEKCARCTVPPVGVAPDAEVTMYLANYDDKNDNTREVNRVLDEIIRIGENPKNRFDVLSMSFKITPSDETRRKIRKINELGTVMVAAAGNDGDTEYTAFPACMGEIISVGSLDNYSKIADHASTSYLPSVYIHGKCLVPLSYWFSSEQKQAANFKTFGPDQGTSMATAALAGLICLIASVAPKKDEILHQDKLLKLFLHVDTLRYNTVPVIHNACNFLIDCDNSRKLNLGFLKRCIEAP